MRQIKKPSKTKQFVSIWKYKGKVYSGVYRYNPDGVLLEYCSCSDKWSEAPKASEVLKEIFYTV